MPNAKHVGLSIAAIFGGVILFAVVDPAQPHYLVKSFEARAPVEHPAEKKGWKDVDLNMVKVAKLDFFEHAKAQPDEVRLLAAGLHARLVEAGVPEDHADTMVKNWVTAAESCDGKTGEELAECFKTAVECHHLKAKAWKEVDWEALKAAKLGLLERSKSLTSAEEARQLATELRGWLVEARVPEHHVDDMVNKWVQTLVKDFNAAQPDAGVATDTECARYSEKGDLAVHGCSKCAKHFPGRVDQCMTCGGICGRQVCSESNFADCVKTASPPFIDCHGACMAKDATSFEQHSDSKLLGFKKFFSTLSRLFWDLLFFFSKEKALGSF